MIRINMHSRGAVNRPAWFKRLLNDAVMRFADDYQVLKRDAYSYIIGDQTDEVAAEKLAQTFRTYLMVDAESYSVPNLPSWGVILKEDDPVIVEYKLKYLDEGPSCELT